MGTAVFSRRVLAGSVQRIESSVQRTVNFPQGSSGGLAGKNFHVKLLISLNYNAESNIV